MPFVGLLLTIALAPMVVPISWQRHYGKITAAWSLITVIAIAAKAGGAATLAALLQTMLTDYLGFIVMLLALYVVAGGILVTGSFHGNPLGNAGMLFARHPAGERGRHHRRRHDRGAAADPRQSEPPP